MAVNGLDDDEKGVRKVYTLGGEQELLTVNEPGLYTLIIRSNKPEAKNFKRWITHEVLPSIRKTGKYEVGTLSELDLIIKSAQTLKKIESFLIGETNEQRKPKTKRHRRHPNRKRIDRTLGNQEKRIKRFPV